MSALHQIQLCHIQNSWDKCQLRPRCTYWTDCLYVLNSSDLRPENDENDLNKYADDTYLLVPSSNSQTVARELEHVSEWAAENNLKLNKTKSVELIIHRPRTKLENCNVPPPTDGVTRLTNIKILGVIVTDTLSFDMHIASVVSRCGQTSYALRIMRAHGLNGRALSQELPWYPSLCMLPLYGSAFWMRAAGTDARQFSTDWSAQDSLEEILKVSLSYVVGQVGLMKGFLEQLLITHPMWCINYCLQNGLFHTTWDLEPIICSYQQQIIISRKILFIECYILTFINPPRLPPFHRTP